MKKKLFNAWKKLGHILSPRLDFYWSQSHMSLPTVFLEGDIVKIFYGSRDCLNRSRISYLNYDIKNNKTLYRHDKPIIDLGELGTFDDNGMMPCSVIKNDDKILLYYVGWNPRSSVRFSFYSGLAISEDGGNNFYRYSRAPILERTNSEPFVNASPFVIKTNDKYLMYYVSGEGWIHKDLPKYNIKIAQSSDGYIWERMNITAVDFDNKGEHALARPVVIYRDNYFQMWFSKKGSNFDLKENYRTGFAYSKDGINWTRDDNLVDLDIGKSDFDNKMICYPYVFKFEKDYYCLYNGNNYGEYGIGLAKQNK